MLMTRVDPEKRRLTGAILSRSFTLSSPPLSAVESMALECLNAIAINGDEATQEKIRNVIGCTSGGVATGIINRLVEKGYVEHVMGHPLQRAIWVRITGTDLCTAEPNCKNAHWRFRTADVPSPAIHQIRQRNITLASMIETKAKQLGKPVHEFLMDCVYAGFHQIDEDEQQ